MELIWDLTNKINSDIILYTQYFYQILRVIYENEANTIPFLLVYKSIICFRKVFLQEGFVNSNFFHGGSCNLKRLL